MAKKQLKKKTIPEVKLREVSVFEIATDRFVDNVDSVIFSLPFVVGPLVEEYQASRKAYYAFLKEKGTKSKKGGYLIKIEDSDRIDVLEKAYKTKALALKTVPRSLFMSLVSFFDYHLRDLLKLVFEINPALLNSTEKKISASEVLELSSFSDAREYILNREIDQLMNESRFKCFDWLEEKTKVKFNFDQNIVKSFVELTERRNLFVHSDGVVTQTYLNVCKRNGVVFSKTPKIGERLTLTPEYFTRSCFIVYSLGVQMAQVLWRKLDSENLKDADINLLNMSAGLIKENKNNLAGRLLDFADKLKEYSSEELRLMLLINRALAMKFGRAQKKALDLINSIDWSAADNKFKLAVSVIKDDFKTAREIMLKIGKNQELKWGYREWPLFKEFRNSKIFKETYKDIFGESFVIEEEQLAQLKELPA